MEEKRGRDERPDNNYIQKYKINAKDKRKKEIVGKRYPI